MAIEIHYRPPNQHYRRGTRYKEFDTFPAALTQPTRPGVSIRIYDRHRTLRGLVSSNAQRPNLISARFELLTEGCGSFELALAAKPQGYTVQAEDRVDVHLWNSLTPIYSGYVQETPDPASSRRDYRIYGTGFKAHTERFYLTQTYAAGTYPDTIAHQLAQDLATRAGLSYNSTKILRPRWQTFGEQRFIRAKYTDILKQIAQLAGGFEWGVDASRELFFRPASTETTEHYWIGKHVKDFDPILDGSQIANQILVKFGKVRADLDPESDYYKTNWLEEPLEDLASQTAYGIRAWVYASPSSQSSTDAILAAFSELAKRSVPTQRATLEGIVFAGQPIEAAGKVRVTGPGGAELTLPKRRVSYSIRESKIDIRIELGDYELTPSKFLADITKRAAEESLARQNSQRQL